MAKCFDPFSMIAEDAPLTKQKTAEFTLSADGLDSGQELELLDIIFREKRSAVFGRKVTIKELLAEIEMDSLKNYLRKHTGTALTARLSQRNARQTSQLKAEQSLEPGLKTAEDALLTSKVQDNSQSAHGSDGGKEQDQSDITLREIKCALFGKNLISKELSAETEEISPQKN